MACLTATRAVAGRRYCVAGPGWSQVCCRRRSAAPAPTSSPPASLVSGRLAWRTLRPTACTHGPTSLSLSPPSRRHTAVAAAGAALSTASLAARGGHQAWPSRNGLTTRKPGCSSRSCRRQVGTCLPACGCGVRRRRTFVTLVAASAAAALVAPCRALAIPHHPLRCCRACASGETAAAVRHLILRSPAAQAAGGGNHGQHRRQAQVGAVLAACVRHHTHHVTSCPVCCRGTATSHCLPLSPNSLLHLRPTRLRPAALLPLHPSPRPCPCPRAAAGPRRARSRRP